jgi:hypothetical protein
MNAVQLHASAERMLDGVRAGGLELGADHDRYESFRGLYKHA